MKIAGIIAEYNPFHNGHIYQLDSVKKALGADATVVVLGGDFTQRGLPAIVDRHVRAGWALSHGADLVLGMPVIGSCDSAECFAMSGIAALEKSGVVTDLVFGTDTGEPEGSDGSDHIASADLHTLQSIVDVLCRDDISDTIRSLCAQGMTYPVALSNVITDHLSPEAAAVASTPNNILAIEYLKAIKRLGSDITPHMLPRVGAGHDQLIAGQRENTPSGTLGSSNGSGDQASSVDIHDAPGSVEFASSTAIRTALEIADLDTARRFVAADVYDQLHRAAIEGELIYPIDTALLLAERLIALDDYSHIYGCSEDLSNRIKNLRDGYQDYASFAETLKTKNLTRTHIDRALCHILLGIRDEDASAYKALDCCPYLYVLGLRQGVGETILGQITKTASIPVITSPKDVTSLSDTATALFKKDLYACDLYRILKTQKSGRTYPTEYTRRFLRL